MLLSIIVPVYNTDTKKLQRCFDSIINQSFIDYECIIVDDGSDKNIALFIDKYIKIYNNFIVIHKSNGGVSSARNLGLDKSKGDWISFIDSDDYIEYNHFETMINSIDECCDIVLTGYKKLTLSSTVNHFYTNNTYIGNLGIYKLLTETDFLYHQQPWDRIYRKNNIIVNNIGFNEKLSLSEDRLFCYDYLMNINGIKTISNITYNHDVKDENSLSYRKYSSSMNKYRLKCFKLSEKKIIKKFKLHSHHTLQFFKDYNEGIYANLINAYKNEGRMFQYYKTRILHKLNLL